MELTTPQLIKQQESLLNFMQRIVPNLKKRGDKNITAEMIDNRIASLNKVWSEFRDNYSLIVIRDDSEALAAVEDKMSEVGEEAYFDVLDSCSAMRAKYVDQSGASTALTSSLPDNVPAFVPTSGPVHLPKASLPTFAGEYTEWESFSDLFCAMVHHENRLSNVLKLQYLKLCLKGSAADFVKNVAVTEANYEPTWAALGKRYNNPRLCLYMHLSSLFQATPLNKESAFDLRTLIDKVQKSVRAVRTLGRAVESWDDLLVFVIAQRLDPVTQNAWEEYLSTNERQANEANGLFADSLVVVSAAVRSQCSLFPTFGELMNFLESRVRSLDMASSLSASMRLPAKPVQRSTVKDKSSHSFHAQTSSTALLDVEKRGEVARRFHLCFNCLGRHNYRDCKSVKRCSVCQAKHHSKLHRSVSTAVKEGNAEAVLVDATSLVPAGGAPVQVLTVRKSLQSCITLLATAQVCVVGPAGTVRVRALLDQGSEVCFVTESLAQLLRLARRRVEVSLSGLGATTVGQARSKVHIALNSIHDQSEAIQFDALVLPCLTNKLPVRELVEVDLAEFTDLTLADPQFYRSERVEMVLGANVYARILMSGFKRLTSSALVMQQTALGWIVSGEFKPMLSRRAERPTESENPTAHLSSKLALHCTCESDLLTSLKQFWELEDVPSDSKLLLNPEEEECEKLFQSTHYRNAEGRYVVRLPFKRKPPEATLETRQMAIASFLTGERRLERDSILKGEYVEFMSTYEKLGHMESISMDNLKMDSAWYLPHHAVVQITPLKRKVRIVFDASRRTATNGALNDYLAVGPRLQSDLSLILTRWRQHRVVFTTDVVKMFRQILVDPADQDFQRIVWRSNANAPVLDYRLTTVTYGTACAPYLAIRTLRQLAADGEAQFPLGAQCLKDESYVDDVFSGADSLEAAGEIQKQLIALLSTAGITLDKWAANNALLLPDKSAGSLETDVQIGESTVVKTLGVLWKPGADTFGFTVKSKESYSELATKREVLSKVAQLFDPLGWLAPVTVSAKILLQDLWTLGIGWDQPLPRNEAARWNLYTDSLSQLGDIAIKRWLQLTPSSCCELHGFADASIRAYAAVLYLRVTNESKRVQVFLLAAKSKVAPVKTVSIPRLELCGAVLLVRLLSHIRKIPEFSSIPVFAWSDSRVTLSWIKKHASFWKVFVANRVSYIQTEQPTAVWMHVPTKDNPADLASRGMRPIDLKSNALWWHGPAWLNLNSDLWPLQPANCKSEVVPDAVSCATTRESEMPLQFCCEKKPVEDELLIRFSSLTRLTRVTAYCLRFAARCRRVDTRQFLTSEELATARTRILVLTQRSMFPFEISRLNAGSLLPRRSPLLSLRPFIDSEGVLRVGGRLQNAELSYSAKHPAILAKGSHLGSLFIDFAHKIALHGGPSLTFATLVNFVWILRGKIAVKAHVRKCIVCHKAKPHFVQQLMGNLPAARTVPSRPFSIAGLDYAGPFNLKTTKGRGHKSYKGYVALFVCFATKAVHLEAVSDLTTEGFLAAYRRFVGRRGVSRILYSDNGTNFKGAATELRKLFRAASGFNKEVAAAIASDGTDWRFIPPNTPHFGGLWEAGIKSSKHHLRRIVGENLLTFEEFTTVLTQIEACLNSRPLVPLTGDLDDLKVLTPGHFLIGSSLFAVPEPDVANSYNYRGRWKLCQQLVQHFWSCWTKEYLHHLQERHKWKGTSINFAVGQLVVIRDDRFPTSKWPLGRIIEVHPGQDGLIRVVTVKTATTTLRRSVSRLSPLPM